MDRKQEQGSLFRGPACSLCEVLEARDRRAAAQRAALSKFHTPLISLTLNLPGTGKRFPLGDRFFAWAVERAEAAAASLDAPLVYRELLQDAGGETALLCFDASADALKAAMVALEDSAPWTRLIDADVWTAGGEQIGRERLGLALRRCFLCGEPAHACAAGRAHALPELEAYVRDVLLQWNTACESRRLGREAQRALLYEVAVTPKPGLVDRRNSGAHRDMDFYTFLDSACALGDYFAVCARMGILAEGADAFTLFSQLRLEGLLAERRMREATGNVNTHMGAIFTLGLLSAAAGTLLGRGEPVTAEAVCARAGRLAACSPVPGGGAPSGARREAALGFPSLISCALPRMRALFLAGEKPDQVGAKTLLLLMSRVSDRNPVRRGGASALERVQTAASRLLAGGVTPESLEALDEALIRENISPGGSADLLAACFFLYFITEESEPD